MPNWTTGRYTLCGDESELTELYRLMKKIEDEQMNYGQTWLGHLVIALGGDMEKIYCRGSWSDLDLCGDTITLNTETAWESTNGVFDLICEKYQSVSYFYYAEEPGMGIYQTNDSEGFYYPERYCVCINTDKTEHAQEYFQTLGQALAWISEATGHRVKSEEDVAALRKEISAHNADTYCYINEIEVV